jgi:hypothetical protein
MPENWFGLRQRAGKDTPGCPAVNDAFDNRRRRGIWMLPLLSPFGLRWDGFPKLQIPSTKLQRNLKLQTSNHRWMDFDVWNFWSLDVGAWSFYKWEGIKGQCQEAPAAGDRQF